MGEDHEKVGVPGPVIESLGKIYKKEVTFGDVIKWLKGEGPKPPVKEEETPVEAEKPKA